MLNTLNVQSSSLGFAVIFRSDVDCMELASGILSLSLLPPPSLPLLSLPPLPPLPMLLFAGCIAMFMVCEMRYFQSFTSSPAVWMCRRLCFAQSHFSECYWICLFAFNSFAHRNCFRIIQSKSQHNTSLPLTDAIPRAECITDFKLKTKQTALSEFPVIYFWCVCVRVFRWHY